MQTIKTNVCYNLLNVGNGVITKDIPQWLFESARFGHTISMKASIMSTPNKMVLYGKCPEIRDVSDTITSLGDTGRGMVYLACDGPAYTPEYSLSRVPREVSFYIRKLNATAGSNVNCVVWLEFTFTQETKDYVGAYMPLHNGAVY